MIKRKPAIDSALFGGGATQAFSIFQAVVMASALSVAAIGQAGTNSDSSSALTVSHRARSLQPGEVVLLTVNSTGPLQTLQAEAFGRTVPFFQVRGPRIWSGLIGIDLDASPRRYQVQLYATSQGGSDLQTRYTLSLKSKQFPTRHLTLEERFVSPPREELLRIEQESKRVEAILAEVSPERLWSGKFLRPVPGVATSSFGRRSILNGQPRSPHSGADFRAAEGTAIKAPNGGKVVLSGDLYFTGNTVILDHGLGLYSYFAHLSRALVLQGDRVASGDVIGYVGSTGRVTGPHLHWSLRLGSARVDPLSLLAVLPERFDKSENGYY